MFTLPHLNEAAKRVAFVIANEPPAQMPVLRGLVDESTSKAMSSEGIAPQDQVSPQKLMLSYGIKSGS